MSIDPSYTSNPGLSRVTQYHPGLLSKVSWNLDLTSTLDILVKSDCKLHTKTATASMTVAEHVISVVRVTFLSDFS